MRQSFQVEIIMEPYSWEQSYVFHKHFSLQILIKALHILSAHIAAQSMGALTLELRIRISLGYCKVVIFFVLFFFGFGLQNYEEILSRWMTQWEDTMLWKKIYDSHPIKAHLPCLLGLTFWHRRFTFKF
jgi:hypothetical protein